MLVPYSILAHIQLPHFYPLNQRKRGECLRFTRHPQTAVCLHKILLHNELSYKIHIDVYRHIDGVFLQGICAVVHHIQAPCKPERTAVHRRKREFNAGDTVYLNRVGNEIVVIQGGYGGGQRTNELIEHQFNIIVEDIDFRKHGIQVGAAAFLLQNLSNALHPFGGHILHIPAGRLLIVIIGKILPQRNREHRHGIVWNGVDVFLQKGKLLVETVFLKIHVKPSEGDDHLRIFLGMIKISRLKTVFVLVSNHFFHQFDGRIALADIFRFLSSGNHHLLQFP